MISKKIFLLIIIIFGILSAVLYINYQSIYQKYITIREKNERLQIENKELSQRLSVAQQEKKRLLERMEVIQRDLVKVSNERDEYKRKFEIASRTQQELIESLKLAREENALLKDQLSQRENEKVELEERLKKTESEKEALNKRLAELEKTLGEKKEISSEETERIELPPIIVKPQELPFLGVSSSISGKIIKVNREYNFVIIDLGEEQGVEVGRSFDVFRDGNLIGRLEVIQTKSGVSACDIKERSLDLEVGDIVR
jgi:predicted nuclease with TOPRIM domain